MTSQLLLELRVGIVNALIPAGRKRESWPGTPAEQQALRQRITAAADPRREERAAARPRPRRHRVGDRPRSKGRRA